MKGVENLLIVGCITFGLYCEVLLMIFADLWSGVRKARQRGEVRSSEKYKRTIDKIARYYNAMLAVTVMDAMQIAGVWYLSTFYGWSIPIFPLVTMILALGISLVEIKSIYEKADEKTKSQATDIAKLAAEIAKNKTDPQEVAKAIVEHLNKEE